MEEKKGGLPEIYQTNQVFRLQLTQEELLALSHMLPKHYSLQIEHKKKDNKNNSKKKINDEPPEDTKNKQPQTTKAKLPLVSETLKPCLKTLQMLQQHKCAGPFLVPVDVETLGIPEYLQIVKEPMDLSTIESKLKEGKYTVPAQFHSDVLKILNNSYLFNQANEDFIKLTGEFERYYYRVSGEPRPPIERIPAKAALMISKNQKKKKKPSSGSHMIEGPLTLEEKIQLATHIQQLAKEHMKTVRTIVFDANSDQNEFDLQKVPQKKLRELQKFIRNRLQEMENKLRNGMLQKNEQQNLDDLQSQITEQFIEEEL